jgi:two-component system CheB/CheR fusion protein
MGLPGADSELYVVLFEETGRRREPRRGATSGTGKTHAAKLEQELAATKEYLQTIIAEHRRTNEDLGLANEELVSGNEELQSMNEELETAKEELQSLNEELTTVNDELQGRNREVVQTNSDLVNVLTAVDIPIIIVDAERRIRRFTPRARCIMNVVATDIGRAFGDIKLNLDVPGLDVQIADVIETMALRESEVQDREGHWYRLRIRPYQTTDHRIDGAILALFDIDALKHRVTDARRATSESEHANDVKDDFLATLSHELRTPLSSMLMRAQLLRRGGTDEPTVIRAGEAIETSLKRQMHLIDDLLDVSRIVAGKLKLDVGPVDLTRVVTAAAEGVRAAARRKSVQLDVAPAKGELARRVLGDDSRLQQIVANLLTNAIKFTPEHGTVKVSLAIDDKAAVIRVTDTGAGITPEFLPRIFDRFSQEGDPSTRDYGGLGLGLAIVRHIVDLHHGTVVAESPGKGKGATFSVTLPLASAERVPPAAASSHDLAPVDVAALRGLRILVVDDDQAMRDVIADMLGRAGAFVRLAASSAEALHEVPEFRPELIVCDIAMPGEDGYAFIRKLRALGVAGSGIVPALALTARARDQDRELALAAGFQMHIAKPVGIDRLTEAVLELTRGRGTPLPATA